MYYCTFVLCVKLDKMQLINRNGGKLTLRWIYNMIFWYSPKARKMTREKEKWNAHTSNEWNGVIVLKKFPSHPCICPSTIHRASQNWFFVDPSETSKNGNMNNEHSQYSVLWRRSWWNFFSFRFVVLRTQKLQFQDQHVSYRFVANLRVI